MNTLYKGYIKTKGKKAIEAFKDRTKYRTYDEVKNLEGFGGVLADDTILIDIDDAEQSEILMSIVEEYQLDCRVYCTSRGRHFLFKNHSITRNRTHVPLAALEQEIEEEDAKLWKSMYEFKQLINNVHDIAYIRVLNQIYFLFHTPERAAQELKRSRSWIYTKHEEAVKAFEQGNEEFLNRWVTEQMNNSEQIEQLMDHLTVTFGFHKDSKTMLVINNVENFICNDDAVASSESVLNPSREVQSLLNEYHRVTAELLGTFELLQNIISVFFRTVLHLTTVISKVFSWIFYITSQRHFY